MALVVCLAGWGFFLLPFQKTKSLLDIFTEHIPLDVGGLLNVSLEADWRHYKGLPFLFLWLPAGRESPPKDVLLRKPASRWATHSLLGVFSHNVQWHAGENHIRDAAAHLPRSHYMRSEVNSYDGLSLPGQVPSTSFLTAFYSLVSKGHLIRRSSFTIGTAFFWRHSGIVQQ